jgi:hypothetical protein
MAKSDPALGQIVGREFQSDFVARQNANPIAPQPARQVGQNHSVMLELYAEQPAWKFFFNRASYFDAVLFAHTPLWIRGRLPFLAAGPQNS